MSFLDMYVTGALVFMLCIAIYAIDKTDNPGLDLGPKDALMIFMIGILWLPLLILILGTMCIPLEGRK